MRLTIAAVGRLKSGPEADLVADYLKRAGAAGRGMGLGPIDLIEIDERKARDSAAQSTQLLAKVPPGAVAVALDERGDTLTSPKFAKLIERERDNGAPEMVFLIGGADGHDTSLRNAAGHRLSFGPMVWPHMLARVMLSEQIYRAIGILAGTPYHRG